LRATRKQLVAQLSKVFPAVALPEAEVAPSADDEERQRLSRALGGRAWTQVSADEWAELRDGLPLLLPEAFASYLAGFLRAALDDDDVREAVVFTLSPPRDLALRRHLEQLASALNASQRAAVADVLRYIARAHGEDFPDEEPLRAATFWDAARA
jgi:hypothetical protein